MSSVHHSQNMVNLISSRLTEPSLAFCGAKKSFYISWVVTSLSHSECLAVSRPPDHFPLFSLVKPYRLQLAGIDDISPMPGQYLAMAMAITWAIAI